MQTGPRSRTSLALATLALSQIALGGVAMAQDDPPPTGDTPPPAGDPGIGDQVMQTIREVDLSSFGLDDLAVWLVIGVVVGSLVCPLLTRTTKGMGLIGNMLLGCIGAVIGGVVVELSGVDLGMGELVIVYEEVVAAMLIAIVLVTIFRLVQRSRNKKLKAKAAAKG